MKKSPAGPPGVNFSTFLTVPVSRRPPPGNGDRQETRKNPLEGPPFILILVSRRTQSLAPVPGNL